MTTEAAVEISEEIHEIINYISEDKLTAIKPLLTVLAGEDYWKPVIETDLTDEEHAILDEGERLHREHPERFTPWEDFLKRLSTSKGKDYSRYARPKLSE